MFVAYMEGKEWFESWFDSPYYHLLYSNRDEKEARQFISKLIDHLSPSKDDYILDLACGKGRHSIYLNELGYKVDGLDYSENNISMAKRSENERLHFFRHDMREPLPKNDYDLILNLFTSFGYFDSDEEHELCLKHVANGLIKGGMFIMDFMNVHFVSSELKESELIERNGVSFQIEKEISSAYIIKTIKFMDKGHVHEFCEKVRAFTKDELIYLLEKVGFSIKELFGDYHLNDFDPDQSERLIIVAEV